MAWLFLDMSEERRIALVLQRLKIKQAAEPKVFLRDRLVSRRFITSTLIVCGDCAGDQPLALKTFLAADFTCSGCGGRSYALASRILMKELKKDDNSLLA